MEMYYSNEGIDSFVDVKIGDIESILKDGNTYRINMLIKNEIMHLISPRKSEVDGKVLLRYNTKSAYIFKRYVDKAKLAASFAIEICNQIFECIDKMAEYLLDPDDLVLDTSYMFYEPKSQFLKLIYIPGYKKSIKHQLKNFVEFLMVNIDHKNREGLIEFYDLYEQISEGNYNYRKEQIKVKEKNENKIKLLSNYTVENQDNYRTETNKTECNNLTELFDEEEAVENNGLKLKHIAIIISFIVGLMCGLFYVFGKRNIIWLFLCVTIYIVCIVEIIIAAYSEKESEAEDESMRIYELGSQTKDENMRAQNVNYQEENDNLSKRKKANQNIEGKECTSEVKHEMDLDNKVQFIYEIERKAKKMVPLTNGVLETIDLCKSMDKIVVGRGKNESDYRIPTTQISRVHASIKVDDSGVYVEDQNSTNGTFINGVKLQEKTPVKINVGDVVSFADEEFFVS